MRRTALLLTPSWTEVAKVQFNRKEWPRTIVWNNRVFIKSSKGYPQERYVETSALFAKKVKVKANYGPKELRTLAD